MRLHESDMTEEQELLIEDFKGEDEMEMEQQHHSKKLINKKRVGSIRF